MSHLQLKHYKYSTDFSYALLSCNVISIATVHHVIFFPPSFVRINLKSRRQNYLKLV